MNRDYDNTIELHGLTFGWTTERDDDGMGEPWKEGDGYGIVREAYGRSWHAGGPEKRAGERVLYHDGGRTARLYDVTGTLAIARRDGWGLSDEARAALAARLGREPTQREITAAAVDADFERMRRWCNGDWGWCGVIVELLDVDGKPTGERESLWGIESDAGEYLEETAHELAEQIAERIGDAHALPDRTIQGKRIRA